MLESTLKEIELRYDNSDRKIFDDFRVPTLENAKSNVKNFFSTYLLEITDLGSLICTIYDDR